MHKIIKSYCVWSCFKITKQQTGSERGEDVLMEFSGGWWTHEVPALPFPPCVLERLAISAAR